MSFVLFVLGLAAAAAGVLMIGFGIPINEFSLGNTLIIAGTTALASGLIVVGLSIVARQLSKIAELLLSRPAGPATSRSSDTFEPAGGGGRMPAPRSAHPADMAPPPPRMPAPAPVFEPAPSFEADEDLPPPPPAPPVEPSVRQEPSLSTSERTARPSKEPSFDDVWPADRRAERIEPEHDVASEPAPAPRLNGDATHRERPARPAPAENVPVSVLKSGVVDGMAYTLYTDGSIEAELAQGVVRFGSIEELRNHLEKGA
ncbi:MAG: hypothetical protein K8F62_10420 [Pseudorhodoplanes sp.]|nr:hypothetical protein [Pseudorhodoplanes sp.]